MAGEAALDIATRTVVDLPVDGSPPADGTPPDDDLSGFEFQSESAGEYEDVPAPGTAGAAAAAGGDGKDGKRAAGAAGAAGDGAGGRPDAAAAAAAAAAAEAVDASARARDPEGDPRPDTTTEAPAAGSEPAAGAAAAAGAGAPDQPRGKRDRYTENYRARMVAEARSRQLEQELVVSRATQNGTGAGTAGAGAAAAPEPPKKPAFAEYDSEEAYEAAIDGYITKKQEFDTAAAAAAAAAAGGESGGPRAARQAATVRQQNIRQQGRPTFAPRSRTSNEVKNALNGLQSPWADLRTNPDPTPALTYVFEESAFGADVLAHLLTHKDQAARLAELPPVPGVWHAIASAQDPVTLLEHFATNDGLAAFDRLTRMGQQDPSRVFYEMGRLEGVLAADGPGGPALATQPTTISKAPSPTQPPPGTANARAATSTSIEAMNDDDLLDYAEHRARGDHMASLRAAGVQLPNPTGNQPASGGFFLP